MVLVWWKSKKECFSKAILVLAQMLARYNFNFYVIFIKGSFGYHFFKEILPEIKFLHGYE